MAIDTTFQQTIDTFRRSFQVRHIATAGMKTCRRDELIGQVRTQYPNFDQDPVTDGKHLIGVLELPELGTDDDPVDRHLKPLTGARLIAADAPFARVMDLLTTPNAYLLMVDDNRIDGIVTRSDLLKLPVRLYSFGLVIYLEQMVGELFKPQLKDAWFRRLRSERQTAIERQFDKARAMKADRELFDELSLKDKLTLWKVFAGGIVAENRLFTDELFKIADLRNLLAHNRNYAADHTELTDTIFLLNRAHHWIDVLINVAKKQEEALERQVST